MDKMIEKQNRFPSQRLRRWVVISAGVLAACVAMYIYIDEGLEINTGTVKSWFTGAKQKEKLSGLVKEKQYGGIKNKLLQSSWIKLFPNLIHLVEVIEEDNQTITSAMHTMVTFEKREVYTVGSTFKAKITSYGEDGTRKKYGGDFFLVTLRRTGFKTDGVSCKVVDKMNGEYDADCMLPWEGEATMKITLLHPSESIYQLMKKCSSEEETDVITLTTIMNSKNESENTNCSIGFPNRRTEELCDYSNSQTEKRVCVKPLSGECGKILWQVNQFIGPGMWDNTYFRRNINYKVPIDGSSIKKNVVKSDQPFYFNANASRIDLNPSVPTGWFENSKWASIKNPEHVSVNGIPKKCVQGRNFYFFGDSTLRQWYRHFIRKLKLQDYGQDNTITWSQGRDANSTELNAHFQYRSHGPPLHNPGPEESRPYISSSLNSVNECTKPSYVLITIGYHFANFDPDVFYSRIIGIREAIRSLLRRCPGVKVFIKGLHYHDEYAHLCQTAWLTYRSEVLLR